MMIKKMKNDFNNEFGKNSLVSIHLIIIYMTFYNI